ncbi:MAG: extracellular solute-binding protein [Hyphomicrobiales bacterium]|nr:extracellular solute-binding protein [Hyphomicrobiales bacterium]
MRSGSAAVWGAVLVIGALAFWAGRASAQATPPSLENPAATPAAPTPGPGDAPAADGPPQAAPSGDRPAPLEPERPATAELPTAASPAPAEEAAAPAPAPQPAPAAPASLSVMTRPGAYGAAQKIAVLDPFEAATPSVSLIAQTYDGSYAALRDLIADGKAGDVVDLGSNLARMACDEGLLEPIDAAAVLGADALDDFIPEAVKPCGIGSAVWSAVVVYNRSVFARRAPASVKDLFDLKAFPGKRALPSGPKYLLEAAMLADGVEPSSVYAALSTPDGVAKAFKRLDQIKSAIVWWDKPSAGVARVGKGEAAMGLAFNGRLFEAAAANRQPIAAVWDGHIYDVNYWAALKGGSQTRVALDFIRFAAAPERMAAQARLTAYGPTRRSAVAQVGAHPQLGVTMTPHLPTAPDNFKRAVAVDEAWWAANGPEMQARFDAWRAGTSP